jgi:acetolactate synthase-1/3 small subunit
MTTHLHTISVLVENKFGVLARVAGMISGRGFNIDSLNVAPTQDSELSRITLVLKGDAQALDLCMKQLRKLINVVDVSDIKETHSIARELVLLKVKTNSKIHAALVAQTETCHAKIIHETSDAVIIEATVELSKASSLIATFEAFGILEIARTGQLALKR